MRHSVRAVTIVVAVLASWAAGFPAMISPPLPIPDAALAADAAPEIFKVMFETTKGNFVVEISRPWAPNGADRFFELVTSGFFDGIRFFRVVPRFLVQFGIHGDPRVAAAWRKRPIPDDPVRASNVRGTISFVSQGPNTRSTQVFINCGNFPVLDGMGIAPIGRVIQGMDVVDKLFADYGEETPCGDGPIQERVETEGSAYLDKEFSALDRIKGAAILP